MIRRVEGWSNEEIKKLVELRNANYSWYDIAAHFPGRSPDSCRLRYHSEIHRVPGAPDPPPLPPPPPIAPPPPVNTKEVDELKRENARLTAELRELNRSDKHVIIPSGNADRVIIGLIGDTHMGSYYECLDPLHYAYERFRAEGVTRVFHTGDILDGEKMYRGHEYEIYVRGADAQVMHCCKNYPHADGIETKFITGNHDGCYWKRDGNDVGEKIAARREDMIYLGKSQADVYFSENSRVFMRLFHPNGGTAYAVSYKVQKTVESLSGGSKPYILAMGHLHKQEYLVWRGVHCFQTGCLQRQTPYMAGIPTPAMIGCYLLEIRFSEASVEEIRATIIPFYEKGSKSIFIGTDHSGDPRPETMITDVSDNAMGIVGI